MSTFLLERPRRNRKSASIRALIQETYLHPSQLVAPIFLLEGQKVAQEINSMPGIFRYTLDLALEEIKTLYSLGIRAIDLFPVVPSNKKDPFGKEALNPENLICQAVKAIKDVLPELTVMVDVALDPYTSHGHDGLLNEKGGVDNDSTLEVLAAMSILAAEAGADIIAPSDMMDGRVRVIREALDEASLSEVSILAYSAKYASSFYGPFRDALGSHPAKGDKKGYQMDPSNKREALREALLDEQEGADLLLVKPALPYLDVLAAIREQTTLPLGAYHVSGEYSMVMAAAEKGWIDADKVLYESLLSIRRAGADFILTYAAGRIARQLVSNQIN